MTIIITLSIIVLFVLVAVLSVRNMLRKEYDRWNGKTVWLEIEKSWKGDVVLQSRDGVAFSATAVFPIRGKFFAHCGQGKSDGGRIVFRVPTLKEGSRIEFIVPRGADTVTPVIWTAKRETDYPPAIEVTLPHWWQKLGIWA